MAPQQGMIFKMGSAKAQGSRTILDFWRSQRVKARPKECLVIFISVMIGMSLAAGAGLVYLYLQVRSRRKQAGQEAKGTGIASSVVWDAADGSRRPAIRDGRVCLDRRSFVTRMASAAMALAGLAAASTVARGATANGGGTGNAEGDHTDYAHTDSQGHHTDIDCDPPTCSSHEHVDDTTHTDQAHIDQ